MRRQVGQQLFERGLFGQHVESDRYAGHFLEFGHQRLERFDELVRDEQGVDGTAFLLFPVEFLGNGGG